MSVTFGIESNPTGTFSVDCYHSGPVISRVSMEEAEAARADHFLTCGECAMYGCFISADMDVEDILDVNLANSNARMILTRIGIDGEDLWGSMSSDDFLGRALVALGVVTEEADAAVSPALLSAPGQAMVVDCGTPEGYTSDVLTRLAALATEAHRLGRDITWG